MWYYPGTYHLGIGDVLAAWLVCIALFACTVAADWVPLLQTVLSD